MGLAHDYNQPHLSEQLLAEKFPLSETADKLLPVKNRARFTFGHSQGII